MALLLSIIDERIPSLIKTKSRGEQASIELDTKRKQKVEMMRVLESRRATPKFAPITTPYSCYNCASSDTALNELICRKNSIFCHSVNFTCGAWASYQFSEKK